MVSRQSLDRAAHVCAAAHGRLDLAVAVRAHGDRNGRAVVFDENVVDEGGVTGAAGGVDGHPASGACVESHGNRR